MPVAVNEIHAGDIFITCEENVLLKVVGVGADESGRLRIRYQYKSASSTGWPFVAGDGAANLSYADVFASRCKRLSPVELERLRSRGVLFAQE